MKNKKEPLKRIGAYLLYVTIRVSVTFDEDITHLEWKNKSLKWMKSKEKPRLKTGAYFLYVTV